jgi:hypothetical protein
VISRNLEAAAAGASLDVPLGHKGSTSGGDCHEPQLRLQGSRGSSHGPPGLDAVMFSFAAPLFGRRRPGQIHGFGTFLALAAARLAPGTDASPRSARGGLVAA